MNQVRPGDEGGGGPETSIVVRTFNEQRHLPALFDAFDGQRYRDFEVIVVDSGSYDHTRDLAAARADRLLRISSHDFTFGYSLNVGIKAARGRFVAMVSAHTVPCADDWLETLVAPLHDETTAMTYGRHLGVASSRFGEAEDFERLFGPEPRIERAGRFAVNNANAALCRALWESCPFDESLLGLEDIAWAKHWMAQGYRVVYEPRAALYHIHEEPWMHIRRRYYREAVAARRIGILGRRHIPALLAREAAATLVDVGRAIAGDDNPVLDRLTRSQCAREAVYFRLHKNWGAIRGLLEAHPLETREETERVLFASANDAVVIHGPGKASLESIPVPELKPGEALIRVAHVGVCATDLEILDGALGYYKNGMASYPIVPGHEFSGWVAATGTNANGLHEGDAAVVECIQSCGTCAECRTGNFIGCAERSEVGVIGRNGAYARYMVAPARFVHKLPAGADLRAAALTEPLAVVIKGIRRLEAALDGAAPRRCAVIGAGPIGHLCARTLAARGHAVTAFDRNPKRRACFAGSAIATAADLETLGGFAVIVEATGDPQVLDKALHASPANATLLLLGLPYGAREFSFEAIAAYDKTVIGSVGSTARDFEEAIALLPRLDLAPLLACAMPLARYAEAWETSRKGEALKVILDVEGGGDIVAGGAR